MLVKCGTLADLVVAVTDRSVSAFEEGSEIGFAISQRHQIAPVSVQQIKHEIKHEIDEVGATTSIGKPHQGDVLVTLLHRGLSPLHPLSPGRIMPVAG
jgi:hypothetical protein